MITCYVQHLYVVSRILSVVVTYSHYKHNCPSENLVHFKFCINTL